MPKEVSEDYTVSVKIGSETHESTAPTIPEALSKFKILKFPGKISATVKHLNKSHTFDIVKPMYFKKVLEYPNHKLLFEKRAKLFLGEL